MAIEYVHTTPDGNITVKWVDAGITNEIHLQNTIADILVQDLLNACRAAEASPQGVAFDSMVSASGKETLGSGVSVGITLQLLGTWKLYSTKGSGVLTVLGGNLVKPDGSSPFRPNNNITHVNVLSASSTIVTTGGGGGSGGLTDEDRALITSNKATSETTLETVSGLDLKVDKIVKLQKTTLSDQSVFAQQKQKDKRQ